MLLSLAAFRTNIKNPRFIISGLFLVLLIVASSYLSTITPLFDALYLVSGRNEVEGVVINCEPVLEKYRITYKFFDSSKKQIGSIVIPYQYREDQLVIVEYPIDFPKYSRIKDALPRPSIESRFLQYVAIFGGLLPTAMFWLIVSGYELQGVESLLDKSKTLNEETLTYSRHEKQLKTARFFLKVAGLLFMLLLVYLLLIILKISQSF